MSTLNLQGWCASAKAHRYDREAPDPRLLVCSRCGWTRPALLLGSEAGSAQQAAVVRNRAKLLERGQEAPASATPLTQTVLPAIETRVRRVPDVQLVTRNPRRRLMAAEQLRDLHNRVADVAVVAAINERDRPIEFRPPRHRSS